MIDDHFLMNEFELMVVQLIQQMQVMVDVMHKDLHEMYLILINMLNRYYVHEQKIIHLQYHLVQLSIMLNHFYRQLIGLMYQYVLMNAIHERWKENGPIQQVLTDHYLQDARILHKPILIKKRFSVEVFFFQSRVQRNTGSACSVSILTVTRKVSS